MVHGKVISLKNAIITALLLHLQFDLINGLQNGLSRLPPMGWMSWSWFKCEIDCDRHPGNCINEDLYFQHADRMVFDGYLSVGYNTLHIDDCWTERFRDGQSRLLADRRRFPRGITGLVDYVHARGLKFGIYADYGTKTCGGYPGSKNFEGIDAWAFADWQVDYLKLDGCWSTISEMEIGYPLFSKYLNASGRQIIYSCSWPAYLSVKPAINYNRIAEVCNLWRNYPDIDNNWWSLMYIINEYVNAQDQLIPVHGPGQWNDPDMLIIGNGITEGASRVQMSVWCIWSAPLIMSTDLRRIPAHLRAILQNREAISIDQDPMGRMGRMVIKTSQLYYFVKPITPVIPGSIRPRFSFAIAIVNFSNRLASRITTLAALGLTDPNGYDCFEVWSRRFVGNFRHWNAFVDPVPPQDALLYKCTLRAPLNGGFVIRRQIL
ncbi:unnamed protein product [Bursaphelenchus xylophilus]|uniref:Alpha-galactosidase n=1 Tax=Bursaphelenchus xylophilus TaxID=6326 RepID=A0A1I7S5Q2_BURXY|nr:unnamed protein product [Bursaphelenchus xylophilus]CAG9124955.1 unnamed protein product [Bursaphelenchus xylophilus]